MNAAWLSELFERLNWSAVLWDGLWAGLVALTLGLSFLLWTRWGEYHLTGKCVILSVLAHLLLGLFFATAEVVDNVRVTLKPDAPPEITIERVQVVDSADDLVIESPVDGQS